MNDSILAPKDASRPSGFPESLKAEHPAASRTGLEPADRIAAATLEGEPDPRWPTRLNLASFEVRPPPDPPQNLPYYSAINKVWRSLLHHNTAHPADATRCSPRPSPHAPLDRCSQPPGRIRLYSAWPCNTPPAKLSFSTTATRAPAVHRQRC